MSSRIFTTANQITLLRLVFVPFFAILVMGGRYRGALVILVAAGITDVVDGLVARMCKQVTPLGMALDPLADKILMTTAYLILAFRGALPWWLTILVLSRDVAIVVTSLVISLVAGYRAFPPTTLGKLSTAFQIITIVAAVSHEAGMLYVTEMLLQICIYLAAAFTLASGIHYIIVVRQRYGYAPARTNGEQDSHPR